MDTAINRLLDFDSEARLIFDEARQYHDKTLEDLALEKKRLIERYEQRAADHLGEVSQSEHTGVEEEIEALWRLCAERKAALDAAFDSRRQGWEDELFRRCLER